jgi:hypothetical protein
MDVVVSTSAMAAGVRIGCGTMQNGKSYLRNDKSASVDVGWQAGRGEAASVISFVVCDEPLVGHPPAL